MSVRIELSSDHDMGENPVELANWINSHIGQADGDWSATATAVQQGVPGTMGFNVLPLIDIKVTDLLDAAQKLADSILGGITAWIQATRVDVEFTVGDIKFKAQNLSKEERVAIIESLSQLIINDSQSSD